MSVIDLSSLEIPHAQPLEHEGGVCELVFPAGRKVVIPKTPREHIAWRRDIVQRGETSERFRRAMLALIREPCPEAAILWFNAFAFLFKQQRVDAAGHQKAVKGKAANCPANSWPCQDWAIRELYDAIHDGHDLVIDKSRQMGVTVLITAVFDWWMLYQPNSVFLCMSEKEDLVDNPKDAFAIFWKIDYVNDRLPWWARPALKRKDLLIANQENGSTLLGRSTTADQGRGGALLAALIDEAASIPVLEAILTSLADTTACRIANSTPKGPGAYSDLVEDGHWPKLVMPWWNHPEKGRGRRLAQDEATGEVYVTSPFYEDRVQRAGGDRNVAEIAQELDMKHALAGSVFFDQIHVLRQKDRYAGEPLMQLSIGLESRVHEDDWIRHVAASESPDPTIGTIADLRASRGGALSLWVDLEDSRWGLRPPQRLTYVVGGDIGQGQHASNSVLSVYCPELARKVGEYASGEPNPHEFARIAALLCIWFGGATRVPWLNLEANGPGQTTIKQLRLLCYPFILRRQGKGPAKDRESDLLGWWNDRNSNQTLLQEYRAALNVDHFINPSARALDEALKYVRYENGEIGPGRLEAESADAKAAHGDRVRADALAWMAAQATGLASKPERFEPPAGSPAADEKILQEIESGLRDAQGRARPRWRTRAAGRRW